MSVSFFIPRTGSRRAILGLSVLLFILANCAQIEAYGNARRDRELQPERVMDVVGVKPDMTIGEVGAGRGYFTFKLATRVGTGGKVFANDIDADVLSTLRDRASDRGLDNIETIVGEITEPGFAERSLDMVFMVYALHDFSLPVELLQNLKASLKSGATIVVIDEDAGVTHDSHFLSAVEVEDLFRQAGYVPVPCDDFLSDHIISVFRLADGG